MSREWRANAGGKRITSYLHGEGNPGYVINLDPAVTHMPFGANIDIRDTVNYKNVMKQYGLGPNGAIITSLNLFATRFDQVLSFVEKRQQTVEYDPTVPSLDQI